jgi:hypothetical protein
MTGTRWVCVWSPGSSSPGWPGSRTASVASTRPAVRAVRAAHGLDRPGGLANRSGAGDLDVIIYSARKWARLAAGRFLGYLRAQKSAMTGLRGAHTTGPNWWRGTDMTRSTRCTLCGLGGRASIGSGSMTGCTAAISTTGPPKEPSSERRWGRRPTVGGRRPARRAPEPCARPEHPAPERTCIRSGQKVSIWVKAR